MIYDPTDTMMAMDEHGVLYYATADGAKDEKGNPLPKWVPLQVIDFRGEFRRPPEW